MTDSYCHGGICGIYGDLCIPVIFNGNGDTFAGEIDTSVAYVPGEYFMTDDKAPVELLGMQVIDQLIREEVAYYKWIYEEQGISGVSTTQSAWSKRKNDETATQIDMIIERKDNIVNMCEIKFYGTEFAVDKSYDKVLRNRVTLQ